jgi:hypothetical protein
MNHFLNFVIIACLLLPFINNSKWNSKNVIKSDVELLVLLNSEKEAGLNTDSLNEEILKIRSKIAEEEIKPGILKWFEHSVEVKNIWFGFDLLMFPPILIFLILGITNIILAFKSDIKTNLHKWILWLIPVSLFSLLIVENPYELMIGFWLALMLSIFKVFRIYNA